MEEAFKRTMLKELKYEINRLKSFKDEVWEHYLKLGNDFSYFHYKSIENQIRDVEKTMEVIKSIH